MSEYKKIEPMLDIPSMEELDRQWRQLQEEEESVKGKKKAGSKGKTAMSAQASGAGRASTGSGRASAAGSLAGTKSNRASSTAGHPATKTGRPAESAGQKSAKKEKKRKRKRRFKKFRLFLKILLLFILVCVLAAVIWFYFKYGNDLMTWRNEAKQLVEESTKDTFRTSETSVIYMANGDEIAELRGDKDTDYITIDQIPQAAIDCMVATEDREFYEHSGVNFMSTAKAAALYVRGKMTGDDSISRGGSTITQQLAKNVFLSNEQSEERKIREMFIAMELEKKYTKDEIMEFYLNNICFANGHFGIEAAALAYFSTSVTELDLAHIAFLCAIPNLPTYYDPLQNFDHTQERKERVLSQLLEEGMISAAEYSDAIYEEIELKPAESLKTQDYMTTFAIDCATKALMQMQGFEIRSEFSSSEDEKEYNQEYDTLYEECHSSLYTGGYKIYTSLNKAKQNKLQKAVNDTLSEFTEKTEDGVYKMQGAATCIDNETGFVVAIVGGRKQKSVTGYTLNRAYQSFRQPGSSFKPLVVYTPQLERGYTPDSIVDDTYFEDGPKNSNDSYAGKITLRSAVEQSKNVVAWKLFEELTPTVGLSYVLKMNFSQIVDSDYYPAASLGGLTNGVSTVEMASGYATIANDGVWREPTCIKKMEDADGNVVVNNKVMQNKKQVYEENATRMMTDILTGVMTRGTAAGKGLSNMPSAGKTGTTSDKKDGWFCGFTPYYTTAVWVGYDTPREVSNLYGSTYPLTIWNTYMEQIHQNLEYKAFAKYKEPSGEKKDEESAEYEETQEVLPEEEEQEAEPTPVPEETPQPTPEPTPEPTEAPVEDVDVYDVPDDVEDVEDVPEDVE